MADVEAQDTLVSERTADKEAYLSLATAFLLHLIIASESIDLKKDVPLYDIVVGVIPSYGYPMLVALVIGSAVEFANKICKSSSGIVKKVQDKPHKCLLMVVMISAVVMGVTFHEYHGAKYSEGGFFLIRMISLGLVSYRYLETFAKIHLEWNYTLQLVFSLVSCIIVIGIVRQFPHTIIIPIIRAVTPFVLAWLQYFSDEWMHNRKLEKKDV